MEPVGTGPDQLANSTDEKSLTAEDAEDSQSSLRKLLVQKSFKG